MTVLKIKRIEALPIFDMPDIYKADKWDVMEWDKYKNSTPSNQKSWKARSNISDNKLNFTIIENLNIREEMKYVMYFLYEVKNVSITTFAEYYDRMKALAEYIKTLNVSSVLDINTNDFEIFIANKGNKLSIENGSAVKGMEIKKQSRNSRFVTFINYAKQILEDYYTKDIPEREKLIWHYDKLPCKKGIAPGKTLDFREIKSKEFTKQAQDFCYSLLSSVTFVTVYNYLASLKVFFFWLESHPNIEYLNQVDRDLIEDFFLYLRTESAMSSRQLNQSILNLKKFFEWGQLFKIENMPQQSLILVQDYTFKTKKDSKHLTDKEMEGIITIISKMPNIYAKIVYVLIFTGMRISELLLLSVDSIARNEDGSYYLNLHQYKTEKDYIKMLDEKPARIILNEIKKNKERFDDVKYVFVSDKNKPLTLSAVNKAIKKAIIENDIKGRDGKLLNVTTHMFRATLATKLLSTGKEPELVAKLLGQSCLASLSHYATIDPKTAKEQLAPRIAKDEVIIRNIFKMESEKEEIPETAIPLCNGFCCKQPETGICKKANTCLNCPMFIPSIQFITSYELQLQEIEATIAIAKTCGYTKMLENCLETKKTLEDIIKRLEEKRNEQEY